jgi:tRNA(fMet)-specific endonuclease VapC
MKKYLLDTNICIHFLKGEFNLQSKIDEVGFENCFISELTIAELLFGVENSSENKREQNWHNVNNLRLSFGIRIYPLIHVLNYTQKKKQDLEGKVNLLGNLI